MLLDQTQRIHSECNDECTWQKQARSFSIFSLGSRSYVQKGIWKLYILDHDLPLVPLGLTLLLFFIFHCFTVLYLKISLIQKQQIESAKGPRIYFPGKNKLVLLSLICIPSYQKMAKFVYTIAIYKYLAVSSSLGSKREF